MSIEQVLVIILGITLAVFLVLAILLIVLLIKVIKRVRDLTNQAEGAVANIASLGVLAKKGLGPAMVSTVVVRLIKKFLGNNKGESNGKK